MGTLVTFGVHANIDHYLKGKKKIAYKSESIFIKIDSGTTANKMF